jgi:arylsulfatase A-like enzyme
VYLWALELQAVYGTDFEPILDRIADSITILWTLVIWSLLFCAGISLIAFFSVPSKICRANEIACRALCILISGFFLARWINKWAAALPEGHLIPELLLFVVAVLYVAARRRRRQSEPASLSLIPSWRDCFVYTVVPLLCLSIVILGFAIANHRALRKDVLASSRKIRLLPGETSPVSPNVILITSDSMRAQSISLYDQRGEPTPFLEQIGDSSSVYLHAHANSTMTVTTLTSLLTGKHPFTHGRLTREFPPSSNDENLPRLLRKHGYATAAVTSNLEATFPFLGLVGELTEPEQFAFRFLTVSWLRDFGVYPTLMGARMYQDLRIIVPFLGYPRRTSPYGHIEDSLDRARKIISRLQRPFFLFIHIHEPHESYALPSVFSLIQPFLDQLRAGNQPRPQFYAHYEPDLQSVVDDYKGEYHSSVRQVDSELGRFFNLLRRRSWFDDALIIFTGDHGESFERGYMNHGEELYENSTRVPLLIRFPGQTNGERVSGLVQSIDIAPTVLNALRIPVPAWMEGQVLAPGRSPGTRATIATNYRHPDQIFYPLPTKLAIWWDQYKMILTCAPGTTELYNMKTDPEERFNLAEQRDAVVTEMKHQLRLQMAKQSRHTKLVCPNI